MKPLLVAMLLIGTLSLPAFVSAPAAADEPIDPRAVQIANDDHDLGEIFLGELERRLIRNYFDRRYAHWIDSGGRNKHKNIPPGLARKGGLPPGIYKQLVRGGHLPREIVFYPLPRELRKQLPRHAGHEYYIADDKVLLVRVGANLIVDVLTVAAIEALD